jgi:hypothetical protein
MREVTVLIREERVGCQKREAGGTVGLILYFPAKSTLPHCPPSHLGYFKKI